MENVTVSVLLDSTPLGLEMDFRRYIRDPPVQGSSLVSCQ